jgi:hypothetical protein
MITANLGDALRIEFAVGLGALTPQDEAWAAERVNEGFRVRDVQHVLSRRLAARNAGEDTDRTGAPAAA